MAAQVENMLCCEFEGRQSFWESSYKEISSTSGNLTTPISTMLSP